jgi:signal transduction histidine kinase/CheY-like chemotaxis protein
MASRSHAGDRALPWFVLGVFIVLTLLATSYVWQTSRGTERAQFDNAVQATRDALVTRIDNYTNVLIYTRGVMVADPLIPPERLRAYIRGLNVQQRYPGISAIGFTLRLRPDDVPRLEAEMHGRGFRSFRVWPATPRSEYHAIILLEPTDRRNVRAMGYDMFTERVRRDAMARARDTGRAVASAQVMLVHEIDEEKKSGFLIYTPIYSIGHTPPTVAERRATLVGFLYAPFRIGDFFGGIFGTQEEPEIGFEIHDGADLLYRTEGLPAEPRYMSEDNVQIGGRVWHIRWISRQRGGAALLFAFGTFLGGMVIAALLFLLTRQQLAARESAEHTAARLRESEGELQRANRAKDEFLATLSHELRTPMTSIMGWSQMLGEDLDPESHTAAVDAIRKSARMQAQLIDDLLDVSRITAGKMRIETRPVELGPVISAAIQTVQAAATAKGVDVHSDLEDRVCVSGDAQRLQQVVWNLLSNAVKFTPGGGEVFLTLRSEDRDAVIEVRDTGQGIEPAFMPHLFERFRQADSSSTRSYMGLGLGLAIVRHLVELHGGTIAAESGGPGTGSTFRVRLPLLVEDGRSQRSSAQPGAGQAGAPGVQDVLRGVRVLVVDDDDEVRRYVAAVFRGSGAEVRTASSARAGLDILAEWPADIVLTDLAMPDADGFDLLHWIRSANVNRIRSVPVVALTAFAMPEDRQRVTEGGFQGFIAKPVEPATLRAAVAEVLRNLLQRVDH